MTPTPAAELEARLASFRERTERLRAELAHTFLGHEGVVELLLLTLLAEGHALLEGAPGLGKTTLVRGLAAALDLTFQRIQFTPDLMPADIIGSRILETSASGGHAFRFEPGPIFAHLLLADEINRATPRTQSALLEAQLDRFLCKIELAAPGERELVAILEATTRKKPGPRKPVLGARDLREMRALVREVPIEGELLRRVAHLVQCTDPRHSRAAESLRPLVRYGASPRGGQALVLLAKARALTSGRPWVTEEDLAVLCVPALRHRLVLSYEGEASAVSRDELIREAWLRAEP